MPTCIDITNLPNGTANAELFVMQSLLCYMTIFQDSVKLEVSEDSRRSLIGWFEDEVSAITAAVERSLIRSAILPELRRLPEVVIRSEYKNQKAGREGISNFARGTQTRHGPLGRRIVRRPGALAHEWLR